MESTESAAAILLSEMTKETKMIPAEMLRKECPKVVEMMKVYGGSFEQALAMLIEVADDENLMKINEAWPSTWDKNLGFWKIKNGEL
jgi:hypothetical protein